MPEIAEVARIVHYIRKHLVNKTLSKVIAVDDANVYGKVGTSGAEFQKALTGRKIVGAGQQGKYFWIVMDKPPHPLMHFGMTGWLKIKSEDTYYYKKKEVDEGEEDEWPPRFWKFHLQTKEEPMVEAAFVDSRRFARIRLLDCKADDIRKVTPLKENGPDPVVDKDIVTADWVMELCRRKKIPIKALLLDQANISGIGNWVGDEIMYHAKMHPEQYSNTLSDEQLKQLHKSIHYICDTAVSLLSDSDKFPEEWLFKHRWGKGKKDAPQSLPNGAKITFLTVGGRTSAVVPSVQKKTGPVAKEMSDAESGGEAEDKKSKKTNGAKASKKRKSQHEESKSEAVDGETLGVNGVATEKAPAKRQRKSKFKEELSDEDQTAAEADAKSKNRKSAVQKEGVESSSTKSKTEKTGKAAGKKEKTDSKKSNATPDRTRRSGRLSRGR